MMSVLATAALAVEIRVATFNIGAHFEDGTSTFSLGAPGTPDHDTVRDILRRVDADIVALQEIHRDDSPEHLSALAAATGYDHVHLPAFTSLDWTFRVVILSRHPFVETDMISSPAGANEITRRFPAVVVDVPGTERDPLVVSGHLKAGTSTTDRFRRAVEMRRLADHLSSEGYADHDNFVILGDFNLSSSTTTFSSPPDGLSGSYALGDDITFPVVYSTDAAAYFGDPAVTRLDPRHLNGSASTFNTTHTTGPTLDLILVSPAIAGRPSAAEIYNSDLDTSNSSGLLKAGAPLPASTSALASDHYLVFADLELDEDYPPLVLTAFPPTIPEGGSFEATVTLPAARTETVEVMLASDDAPAVAAENPLVIPAGGTTASTTIFLPRNFLAEPPRTATITASATAFGPATVAMEITDADGPYVFTAPGQTLAENFDGFGGIHAPAPWTTTGSAWSGMDEGSGTADGFRSYRKESGGSLGHLGNAGSARASTTFTNSTGAMIDSIGISYRAQQWRFAENGTADSIAVSLVHEGTVIPLEELSYRAGSAGADFVSEKLAQSVDGLAVLPDGSFELRFDFLPGAGGGPPPADVFINEFHYDNVGADTGEFVEIVAGPGFSGDLSEVTLYLYNGANGQIYGGTHALDTFTAGPVTASGHRLFWKAIPEIQNGAPDGFALVAGGEVRQFISYEGTMTAANGPAAGMTSVDVGVSQTGSEAIGTASLGLSGSGGISDEFDWAKFAGHSHTPGEPNPGQVFTAPLPAQGLAIDDVAVTAISSDPLVDSDGDGQSDADERLFGTNPNDAASRYAPTFEGAPGSRALHVPTLAGRTYVVETSPDLGEWSPFSSFAGTGEVHAIPLPADGRRFFRVRVTLVAP